MLREFNLVSLSIINLDKNIFLFQIKFYYFMQIINYCFFFNIYFIYNSIKKV